MASDIKINLSLKEWRAVRNLVIIDLHHEFGLKPSAIVRLRMEQLYPNGWPLKTITMLDGLSTFTASRRLREGLTQLYPQPLLIDPQHGVGRVITNRPAGRTLTAATVGRILRNDRPF